MPHSPSLLLSPEAVASLATRTCLRVAISSSVLVNSSFHCCLCDSWGQLYKNRSSRKIDYRRLFSSEYDFPKTFSLTEFSGKTYFYAIGSRSFNAGFDEKNLELQEKNIELERRVLDLEDSLKAKEELVKARTEAVTLLSADLSQKGRATLDQLEDTRTEMRSMQEQFTQREAEFKQRVSLAEVDAAAKDRRFRNVEQDVSRLDRARFELCAKNAALQEKVVGLQSELQNGRRKFIEEEDRFEEERTDMRSRIEELEKDLRVARQSRQDGDRLLIAEVTDIAVEHGGGEHFGQMIVKLENKIAELEEDKGNLQLKVVELEESNGREHLFSSFDLK